MDLAGLLKRYSYRMDVTGDIITIFTVDFNSNVLTENHQSRVGQTSHD